MIINFVCKKDIFLFLVYSLLWQNRKFFYVFSQDKFTKLVMFFTRSGKISRSSIWFPISCKETVTRSSNGFLFCRKLPNGDVLLDQITDTRIFTNFHFGNVFRAKIIQIGVRFPDIRILHQILSFSTTALKIWPSRFNCISFQTFEIKFWRNCSKTRGIHFYMVKLKILRGT